MMVEETNQKPSRHDGFSPCPVVFPAMLSGPSFFNPALSIATAAEEATANGMQNIGSSTIQQRVTELTLVS